MAFQSYPWQRYSNTPDVDCKDTKFIITHPFHPLHNQEFDLVTYRHNWGEDRVYFHDRKKRLTSVPASCTSVIPEDPFVKIAAGRSFFRADDLIRLCNLIQNIKKELSHEKELGNNHV